MPVFRTILITLIFCSYIGIGLADGKETDDMMSHQILGDKLRNEGKLEEALKEYEEAKNLGGENPELLKKIATIQKWLRNLLQGPSFFILFSDILSDHQGLRRISAILASYC